MKKSLYSIFAGLLLLSCTQMQTLPDEPYVSKIAGTSQHSESNTLSVKFDSSLASAIELSGKAAVEDIFGPHLKSIERVFPYDRRYEADTRKAGLDRWYLLVFDDGVDLDSMALKAASFETVARVQFSKKAKKADCDKAIPLLPEDMVATKAATKAMVISPFNDPDFYMQWGLANNADQAIATTSVAGADINVVPAWKLTTGDPRVIVAVIDDGVKYTHPDLAANMWVNPDPDPEMKDIHGYNFVDGGPISWGNSSDTGHGTHVAGIVAAVNNNADGICGIAGGSGRSDGVRLMSCQIFSGSKTGNDFTIARAIKYAADHGASILQCSFGYESGLVTNDRGYLERDPLEFEAMEYFRTRNNCAALDGGLIIFAAGNEGAPMSDYPGGYTNYISVTAFSPDFLPSYYTNYGRGCNISAPGGEITGLSGGKRAGILSTLCSETSESDYGFMQGTSMACPHVSGVAALGLSYALKLGKRFTEDEFNAMLLTSVNDIDHRMEGVKRSGATLNLEDYQYKMGTGSIDAYRLLMQIEGTACVGVTVGELSSASLDAVFGDSSSTMTYTSVEISSEDAASLGVVGSPRVINGMLQIRCNRPGSAKVRVKAIAGGKREGTSSSMGGMEITREFAIIARYADNSGRWF